MSRLHVESRIYLFDRYLALQDVLNSPFSAKMNRRLVGVDELLVEEKLDKLKVKMIQDADYAGVFFKEKFYIFKIIKKEMHNHITFRGINYAYDELANLKVIEDRRLYDVAGSVAIQVALEGTPWELGTVQSTSTKSTNFYYVTPLEAIQKVIETWGVEPDFYFTFDGRKITGRKVDVYQKRGKLVGERYVYGSDLLEIVHEENRAEIVTALYGRGKGEETLDKDGNPTGGYGRRINFSDVVWSKAKGDPVNKPKGVEYLEITEATSLYGYPLKDGALSPRYAVYINDQIEDPVELIHETYKVLANKARPILTLSTTVAKVGPYELGDTNYIIRPDLGIMYEARIFEDEINLLDESKTTFKFGDYVLSGTAQRMKDLKARFEGLNGKIEGLDKQVKNQLIKISKDWFDSLIEEKGENFFSGQSFNYSLESGNEFGLPAGIYSFDRAIDANPGPTGFMVIQGGKLGRGRITPSGEWEFNLIGDADGLTASAITAGKIKAQFVEIGPSSTFLEGYDPTKKANANDVYTKTQIDTRFTILDGEISSKITTEVTDVINEIGLPEDGYTPVKGIDYFDGTPGKDGKDGISEYLHIRYSQTSDGASPTTDPTNAKYIGVAVSNSETPPAAGAYKWTLIKGQDGEKGTPGEPGPNGKTSYLHIKYSNDGVKFTGNNGEDVGDWIGTYVDFVEADSDVFNKYTWNKVVGKAGYTPVKGLDYFDGIPGKDGKNGTSKFLHVRYSQTSDGANPTTNPNEALYIGVAVTESDIPPVASLYKWTLIKGKDGEKGDKGTPGEPGANGKTSYLHIKYSNNGTSFTGNAGENVGKFIGTYVDFIEEDSTDFNKYTWNRVVGEDGYTPVKGIDYFDGIPGLNGKDGKDGTSKYLHIRYSQTANGSSPTTNPANAVYMGIAITESNDPPAPALYNWSLIKGQDGTPGAPGPSGKTSYLHIKYSNNGTTFTANNGETVGEWIGTYVDFVEADSNTFSDYTWNKIAGRSIESVVVEYAQTTSPTSVDGATWSTTSPTWIKGRYIWSRTKTTYSTGGPSISQPAMITGSEGKDGNTGAPGAPGQGITSIKPQYYLSTSKTSRAGGSWQYTPPTIDTLKFMWTRNEIVWKNPTATTYTTEILSQEIEEIKEVIKRVVIVESRTTKNAIIGTIRDETTSDGKPLFAKTSEVKQEVDNWTARFGYIGGRNLIKNSEEMDFTGWEGSNVTITRGIIVSAWGATNAIRVRATSGNGTALLKAFSSLYTNHDEMRGKTYTLSAYVRNDRTDADVTIHSLRFGSVTLKPRESQRVVITGSSTADASVHLQLHAPTPAHYVEVTIWHPQLELGEVVTDWRPHSDELYAGYTRIDQDGVTVGKDFGDTETSITSTGMLVKNKDGTTLLEIEPNRSFIPHLHADNIYAENVVYKIGRYGGLIQRGVWLDNVARGDGSGRDINNTSDNLKEALDYATEGGSVLNNAVVSVNILGTRHTGNWEISGYTGNGSIDLYFYPNAILNGSIDIIDNSCRVIIRTAELGNAKVVRATARDTILIKNSSAVEITRIAVMHPSGSDYPLSIENSRVLVNRCELTGNSSTFPKAAAYIALNSQTYFDNCSGNTTDAVYHYTTGSSVVSYQYRPKASNTTNPFRGSLGYAKAVDDIAMESRVVVPSISWVPITKTFTAKLHRITQSTGYRTNGSFVQGTSPNNRSQAYRGYASWGSAIYDWLRANGGYQNITSIKLYATRGGFGYGDSDLIFTNPSARTIPAIPRYGTKFSELKGYTLGNLAENSTDFTINTTTLSTANYADFTKIWISITVNKRV